MKLNPSILCLSAALLVSAGTLAADQDVITKSFTSKPGGKLVMNVDRGSIKITTGSSDAVNVKVVRELKRGSNSKAREIYQKHKIEMTQEGDNVKILVERPKGNLGLGIFGQNPFNGLHVEYTISVPSEYNLEVRTAGGNINVADLKGEVHAHTSGGNVELGKINGAIDAHTSGGNISLQGSKGPATLRTSGGDLRLHEIDGDLTARTSGGSISVERVRGSVRAETSGGNIRVREAHGPIYAHTSGGNVSAQLMAAPAANCALKTSGGNVAITLPQKSAVDINARTSGGSIRSDFPGEMNKQRTRLVAQINGGGPDVLLETSGGDVEIRGQ